MRFWKFIALFPIILFAPLKPCWAAAGKNQNLPAVEKSTPAKVEPANSPKEVAPAEQTEFKRWEARISPIAMLVSWYTVEAAIHFNDHWALGPTFTGYAGSRHPFLVGLRGTAVGFFTAYYLEALPASGWYLSLRIQKQRFSSYPASESSSQVIKHIAGNTADLIAGYRKQMANNFFILLGAGLRRQKYKEVEEQLVKLNPETRYDRVVPYFEAKLGLDF
jgi:hypothetical protein